MCSQLLNFWYSCNNLCLSIFLIIYLQGDEGYRLHLAAAEETDGLKPAHNYVPWITTNKKHSVTDENLILEDLVAWACNNYDGVKIEAC